MQGCVSWPVPGLLQGSAYANLRSTRTTEIFWSLLFCSSVSHSQVPVMYNNNRLMGPPGSHPPSTGVSAGPALPQPPIVSSNSSSNGTQVFSTSELGQHSNFPCQTHFPVNANSGSASSASPKQVDTKKGSSKPSFFFYKSSDILITQQNLKKIFHLKFDATQ